MKQHVIIAGAGIVGISTAIWLQRYGCKVTLIDRQIAKQAASYGNAGILAQCSIIPVTVPGLLGKAPKMLFSPDQPLFLKWSYLLTLLPWLRKYLTYCNEEAVRRIAAALVPLLASSLKDHQALAADSPAAAFIKPDDFLYLYNNRAEYQADQLSWQLRQQHGYQWQELEGQALSAYDPLFSNPDGEQLLVRFNDHGRISSPGGYLKALTDYALANGAELIQGEVVDIIRESQEITGLRTRAGQRYQADAVAVTSGIWSPILTEKLGVRVPVESERGYHLELVAPNLMPRSPVMINSGKFVMTPMQHQGKDVLRLAGIVEFGGLKKAASKAPHDLLRRKIRELLPELRWESEKLWLGHRPAPVDSIPLIGKIHGMARIYLGFGHHHVGLTSGPRTGQLLAQLITAQETGIDMTPYRPERFM